MKARENHLLQSLRSAHQFITNHATELGSVPHNGSHRRLCEALERASVYANAQCGAQVLSRSATLILHVRRKELLRDHLAPLVAIAVAQGLTPPEPQAFRMPPRRARVEQLRAYAVGIAEAARPFTPQFVQTALPADFANRMVAAAQAFLDAANERQHQRMRGREATHGLAEQLRRGRRTVQVLDAMVRSKTHGRPELFEAWCSAIKPQAGAGRSRPEVEAVPALVAPPTLVLTLVPVEELPQVEAKPRLRQLWRGPMRRRWAA